MAAFSYQLKEDCVQETSLGVAYDSAPVAELPVRALSGVAVFEATGDALPMRDLELLDDESHPSLDVVGRLTKLDADGGVVPDAEPGPSVRLSNVSEWSVEYDELTVVLWVSTEVADYKLLSTDLQYEPFWLQLQRKAAVAARSIALLIENPNLTLKQLRANVIKLNNLPNQLKISQDEFVMHADFVAEQIAGAQGLAECRALVTLREQLNKSTANPSIEAAAEPASEGDPNKRARKAPKNFLSELETLENESKRKTPSKAKDPNAPKPAQDAFAYFSKVARAELLKEAKAQGDDAAATDVAQAVADRWSAAGEEERRRYEDLAEADYERFILETRQHEIDQARERNKAKKRTSMGGNPKGMLACERDPTPAKRRKLEEAAAAEAAAAGTPGGAGSGTPFANGATPGSRREDELEFPMEDEALLRRERAHRQMLVASGRSKKEEAKAEPSDARYVYPPRGPPPAQLPPLPTLPEPAPITVRLAAPDALDRLVTIWDFCNSIGHALKARPLALPLAALENALGCSCPLDYELATQLHCVLLRVLIPDYDGLEGWGPWVKSIRDPLLPLQWPRRLMEYFSYHMEFEEEAREDFDKRFGDGRADAREGLVATLASREWPALGVPMRLTLFAWLVDRVSQTHTVRFHLDRHAEAQGALRREMQGLLDEEEAKQAEVDETKLQMAEITTKLADAQAQLQRKGGGGSGARGAGAAQTKANAQLAELRTLLAEQTKELRAVRARRLEQQQTLGSMALRADRLGKDRQHREYLYLAWPGAGGATPQLLVREPGGGGWARLRGGGAVRHLYGALHPDGAREGPLHTVLGRHRLRAWIDEDRAAAEKAEAVAEEKQCKPHASKGLPLVYRDGTVAAPPPPPKPGEAAKAAAAGAADAPPHGVSGGTRGEVSRDAAASAEAAAAPPPAEPASAAALPAAVGERLRKLAELLATRVRALPDDPLDPNDRPVLRNAAAAVAAMAEADAVASLPPPAPQTAAQWEQLRTAVLEFEDRLSGAAQAWAEQPAVHQPWLQFVRRAALPRELAAALLVLDAVMHTTARTRLWGVERSSAWRGATARALTMSDLTHALVDIDDCCNWDALEKQLEREAAHAPKANKGRAPAPPRVRRRCSLAEFAHVKGLRTPVLEWCDMTPAADRMLRARANNELFGLTPLPDGGWEWMSCGPAADAYSLVDLRGLTVGEAKGQLLTVWYEEENEQKVKVDVAYVGQVVGVSLTQKGLTVKFDVPGHVSLVPDGNGGQTFETMQVSNEDDWLWGVHHVKPGRGGRIRGDHGAKELPPEKDSQ